MLIHRGATVNARDSRGSTALLAALTTHYYKSDLVRLLVERGADVNAASANGLTPLMCAFEPDFMRRLIEKGADIHAIDREGRSVLYHQARSWETIQILIEKGARPRKDEPVAQYAISGDFPCFDCAKILLDKGVDINARNRRGETVLMLSVHMDELSFVKNLLERGADVKAVDNEAGTALHQVRFIEYAELLVAAGATVDARNKAGQTPLIR